jgi:coronin-1B/1C/6
MKIWDVEDQAEAYSVETGEQVWNMKWNWTGSLVAASTKDKKLKIFDPRASACVAEWAIHDGSKASKVEWIGTSTSAEECNKIVTTGFSSQAERQIAYWDMRMMGETADPLNLLVLDNGTGALLPFYDDGTGMLFVAGKGDANCRFFEITPEDPWVHWINQYGGMTPQKGFCFLPKRACDTKKHEIMRGLQMQTSSVVPISFTVPRKSEAFQEDLFPDGPAGVPAMSAEDWKGGAEPKPPALRSMAPGAADLAGAAPKPAMLSVKDLKAMLKEAEEKIKSLEAENALLKAENEKLKAGA